MDKQKIKNPWTFTAPPYDQRSSVFVNAGTHHGVGKRNPCGEKPKGK